MSRPEAEVGQDLFDDLWPLNEGNDPHRPATLGAQQGISLIDLFDQPRPVLLECPAGRGRWDLDQRGWCRARPFALSFPPLSPADVALGRGPIQKSSIFPPVVEL